MHWDVYANRYPQGRYYGIGEKRWVELHGGDEVYPVRVTEDPEGDYYGWREAAKAADSLPTMIWQSLMQLDMCFPYGVYAEEGRGSLVRMRIEAREETA